MRAVKAHLGTSPFAPHRPATQPTGQPAGHRARRAGGGDPAARALTEITVPRPAACYWHGCQAPATLRVGFHTPSVLAGETRDYCASHTSQVAARHGTMILARLHVDPDPVDPDPVDPDPQPDAAPPPSSDP